MVLQDNSLPSIGEYLLTNSFDRTRAGLQLLVLDKLASCDNWDCSCRDFVLKFSSMRSHTFEYKPVSQSLDIKWAQDECAVFIVIPHCAFMVCDFSVLSMN